MMATYTSPTIDELIEMSRKLHDEMSDEDRANYTTVNPTALGSWYCEATNIETGIRSRFHFAEHFNIGPGWMMLDVDRKHRGVVSSFNLADVVAIETPEGRQEPRSWNGENVASPCPDGWPAIGDVAKRR